MTTTGDDLNPELSSEIYDADFAMNGNDNDIYGAYVTSLPSFGKTNQLQWKYKANLVGEKIINPSIHLCERCNLPILIYGRMIPCKHIFCYDCALQSPNACLRCSEGVFKIEKCNLGTVFLCRNESCKRTYLSQRDLEAHIKHRHVRKADMPIRLG